MSPLRIEKLRPGLEGEYDSFLLGRPETLIYHCSKYRGFLKDLLGCADDYLLAFEGETIRGALPLMYAGREGARVYNSLPFYGSNGGIVGDDARARRALASAYAERALDAATVSATVIDNPFAEAAGGDALPQNLADYRIAQFTRIAFPSAHREQIAAVIDASARRNVAKAAREGVTVEVDHTQMDRLREMHRENITAIGGTSASSASSRSTSRPGATSISTSRREAGWSSPASCCSTSTGRSSTSRRPSTPSTGVRSRSR